LSIRRYIYFFSRSSIARIYTLSLHDALPIWHPVQEQRGHRLQGKRGLAPPSGRPDSRRHRGGRAALLRARRVRLPLRQAAGGARSEEHTSELQSRSDLVCRLLLEKKKQRNTV